MADSKPKILRIEVDNTTGKEQSIMLFNASNIYTSRNFGIPDGVVITGVYDLLEPLKAPMSYGMFLSSIIVAPTPIRINSSTNNRQLAFYKHYFDKPQREPMEPGLTKAGKQRSINHGIEQVRPGVLLYTCKGYRIKWNPKKWNIADTHEDFIMDIGFQCELLLKPLQIFNLDIEVCQRVSLKRPHHIKLRT